MSYTAEVSRRNPTCILFLIDQSGSMNDVMDPTNRRPLEQPQQIDGRTYTHVADGPTKATRTADIINRLINNLIGRCVQGTDCRDYFHVGAIGYGARVATAFGGQLADCALVPISTLAENPLATEEREKAEDDGAGGLVRRTVKLRTWIQPICGGDTPMCKALEQVRQVLDGWLPEHPECFPPIVFNISDGEATDGTPLEAMRALSALTSHDGPVLLYNLHITANPAATPVVCPNKADGLPDEFARTMFEGASPLPPVQLALANKEYKLGLAEGARGFLLNGNAALLIELLEIGSSTAAPVPAA